MRFKKEFLIPLGVLVFALMGLEIMGTKFNIGNSTFHDSSAGYLTLNKGMNVNGTILQNGSPISGASVSFDTIFSPSKLDTGKLFYERDTTRLAGIKRANTFTGTNQFSGLLYTGTTETGNLTVTGTFDVTVSAATFGAAIQLIDNTKVITASGSNILYKVSTGGAHMFETQSGTDMLTIDSTNGTKQMVKGYQSRGLMQTLVYQTPCSTVTSVFRRIAHGLGPNITHRLLDVDIQFYDDSTKTWYPAGYNRTTTLATGAVWEIDTTNLSYYVPAAAGNFKNQSDTIRWVLRVLTP